MCAKMLSIADVCDRTAALQGVDVSRILSQNFVMLYAMCFIFDVIIAQVSAIVLTFLILSSCARNGTDALSRAAIGKNF